MLNVYVHMYVVSVDTNTEKNRWPTCNEKDIRQQFAVRIVFGSFKVERTQRAF